jgi:hypothetical protein
VGQSLPGDAAQDAERPSAGQPRIISDHPAHLMRNSANPTTCAATVVN